MTEFEKKLFESQPAKDSKPYYYDNKEQELFLHHISELLTAFLGLRIL
jgi:hypothetical protein